MTYSPFVLSAIIPRWFATPRVRKSSGLRRPSAEEVENTCKAGRHNRANLTPPTTTEVSRESSTWYKPAFTNALVGTHFRKDLIPQTFSLEGATATTATSAILNSDTRDIKEVFDWIAPSQLTIGGVLNSRVTNDVESWLRIRCTRLRRDSTRKADENACNLYDQGTEFHRLNLK